MCYYGNVGHNNNTINYLEDDFLCGCVTGGELVYLRAVCQSYSVTCKPLLILINFVWLIYIVNEVYMYMSVI